MDINIQKEIENINSIINISANDKMNLEKKTKDFIDNEVNTINNKRENDVYSKINGILEQIVKDIQNEFKLNKGELHDILEKHKFKLSESINLMEFDDDYEEETPTEQSNSDNEESEETTSSENKICGPIPCQATKGNDGVLCGRMTIIGTEYQFCGYHKKYYKK